VDHLGTRRQRGCPVNTMSMRWGRLYRGTPAELSIEPAIAALGVPYRTQFPGFLFGFRFFPDFYLPTLAVVIEVDDRSHRLAEKVEQDEDRTRQLEDRGWTVVRCTNEEALGDPYGAVRRMLAEAGYAVADGRITRAPRVPLADCLPKPGRAPKKITREAKSQERQRRRSAAPRRPKRSPSPGEGSACPSPADG